MRVQRGATAERFVEHIGNGSRAAGGQTVSSVLLGHGLPIGKTAYAQSWIREKSQTMIKVREDTKRSKQ